MIDPTISRRAHALLGKRLKANRGRVNKVLGSNGPFKSDFKKAILDNHEGILGDPFLVEELKAYKRIRTALEKSSDNHEASKLLSRLDRIGGTGQRVLCPLWRHERWLELAYTSLTRYMFEEVFDQLFFATVVIDYSPDLYSLEASLPEYRRQVDEVVRIMGKQKCGLMMFGSFEPDLRSQFQMKHTGDLSKARRDLNWKVADWGGWVTSAHLVGRAVQLDELEAAFNSVFPAENWNRVHVVGFKREKPLLDNLLDISSYLFKYPEVIFRKNTTKGKGRDLHNEKMRKLRSSFMGATMPHRPYPSDTFDQDRAITQWALFTDRVGPRLLRYSVESAHAQRWLSRSETQHFMAIEDFDWLHGYHRNEVFRDTGPYRNTLSVDERRRSRSFRKRQLVYDEEWLLKTDMSHVSTDEGHSVRNPFVFKST